jgi:hypothetical protein
MIGTNGRPENDNCYFETCEKLFPNVPLLHYKHIFGESYTAPALGIYAAAICLRNGKIPALLKLPIEGNTFPLGRLGGAFNILFYNNSEGKNHSFILLSKC